MSYRVRAIVTAIVIFGAAALTLKWQPPRRAPDPAVRHASVLQQRAAAMPTLSGYVLLAGKRAPGVKVRATHALGADVHDVATTLSDSDGHYAFAALATDPNLVVTAFYDVDYSRPKSRAHAEAVVTGTPTVLDLDLALASEIDGVVVDAHGAPVPFARIETRCAAGSATDCPSEAWSHFPAKGDGTFALGGLGGGTISFVVRPDGKTSGPAFAPAAGHPLPTVQLATDSTHVTDIKLAVDPTRPLE